MVSDTAVGAEYGTLVTFVVPESPRDVATIVFTTIVFPTVRPPRLARPPARVTGRLQLGLLRTCFARGGEILELPGTAL
jgi:hypothetical protein